MKRARTADATELCLCPLFVKMYKFDKAVIPENVRSAPFFCPNVDDYYSVVYAIEALPTTQDEMVVMAHKIVDKLDLPSPLESIHSMLRGEIPESMRSVCVLPFGGAPSEREATRVLWFARSAENNTIFIIDITNWFIVPGFCFKDFRFEKTFVAQECKDALCEVQSDFDRIALKCNSDEWKDINQKLRVLYNAIEKIA